jgi:hypothetical protein
MREAKYYCSPHVVRLVESELKVILLLFLLLLLRNIFSSFSGAAGELRNKRENKKTTQAD